MLTERLVNVFYFSSGLSGWLLPTEFVPETNAVPTYYKDNEISSILSPVGLARSKALQRYFIHWRTYL